MATRNGRPAGETAGEGVDVTRRGPVHVALIALLAGAATGLPATAAGGVSGLAVPGIVIAAGALLGGVAAVPALLVLHGGS